MYHFIDKVHHKEKKIRVSYFLFLSSVLWVMSSGYVLAYTQTTQRQVEKDPKPKTAIEMMTDKRIPETTLKDNRPPHVYRPRTPIFHKYHPENVPTKPVIKRHLLVDHPELNNNQGRDIRQNKIDNVERVQ